LFKGTLVSSYIETGATHITKVENGKDEGEDLKGRMKRMESKSQRQEIEIEVLKSLLEEEKKFSKQLGARISQLEDANNPTPIEKDRLLRRPKRPYRLIPSYAHR